VIFIIAFIAGLLILLGPALLNSEKAARGAQMLQGSLFIAKQQALRNEFRPYGIRLLVDPNNPTQATSFQYIEQPGLFTGGQVQVNATAPTTVNYSGVDPTGGLSEQNLWPVQPGDYIWVNPSTDPRLFQIASVNPTANPTVGTYTLATPYVPPDGASAGTPSTTSQIVRRPRPVAGEDTLLLPDDVIIDLSVSIITPEQVIVIDPTTQAPTKVPSYDILFAPDGSILGAGGRTGKIVLWVRDTNQALTTDKEQSLITVFTRGGLIASYAVDITPNGDPYSFTRDPRASGF